MATEELHIGGPAQPSPGQWSRAARLCLAASLLIASITTVSSVLSWRDAHTLSTIQVTAAVNALTPTGISRDPIGVRAPSAVVASPVQCQPITTLGLSGSYQRTEWSDPEVTSRNPDTLIVGRYATGAEARRAWAQLGTALDSCGDDPITTTRPGAVGTVRANSEARTPGQRLTRQRFWQLHLTGTANDIDVSQAARRYGNVLVIYVGPSDQPRKSRASLIETFTTELARQSRR